MNGKNTARISKKSHNYVNRYISGRRLCSYKECTAHIKKTRNRTNPTISLFNFPVKDTERCSVWITNSGREEFRYLTPKELANKRVCELHFEEFMFSNLFKTTLKKNAVPNQFDKVTPEMFQNDDDSNDEDESGIASESSSNHNNQDFVNALCANKTVIEDKSIDCSLEKRCSVDLAETSTHNKYENENSLAPVELPLVQKQFPTIVSCVKDLTRSPLNIRSEVFRHHSTMKQKTKFHNLPPSTMQNDFYFQTCSESAEETNNSMPEPLDGEMPLFVQHDSAVSLADEPANSEVFEPLIKRRKRDKDDEDLNDQIRGAVKDLKNITSLLSNNDDEFDMFGKIVALQLKKMSLCTALEVQAKIQNLLSQHRISDIQKEHKKIKAASKPSENHKEVNKSKEVPNRENGNGEDFTEDHESAESPQLSLTCASEHSDNNLSGNNN